MKSGDATGPLWLTRDQCRAVDRYAIEALGVPGLVLMENAGRQVADLIERRWRRSPERGCRSGPEVICICGTGNNGGDGFVVARQLFGRIGRVRVDLVGDPDRLRDDAATNFAILERLEVPVRVLRDPSAVRRAAAAWKGGVILVDALLGTGFSGEVRSPILEAVAGINAVRGPVVVAVDLPSGLDADTGRPQPLAVRAHETVTFVARKVGFRHPDARAYLGRVTVADIGVPAGWILARL